MINTIKANATHNIVVVGGGAAGLELMAQLSRKFFHSPQIRLTLIDRSLKHLWKPLLHEIAAGTLTPEQELSYITYAYKHRFNFILGNLAGINRQKKTVLLAPVLNEHQQEISPAQAISYDTLIIAIGSKANDFSIKGVKKHCYFIDHISQAEDFQKIFYQKIVGLTQFPQQKNRQLTIAIVGGGATGVELASELYSAFKQAIRYSRQEEKPLLNFFKIILLESSKRIVRTLPGNVSGLITKKLTQLGVEIKVEQTIAEVTENGLITDKNLLIPADMMVWAAGIKAPSILKSLDGLEVNALNQLQVNLHLQTTQDKDIFAIGDCASCYQPQLKTFVPPRAQAAHQQARFLAQSLKKIS